MFNKILVSLLILVFTVPVFAQNQQENTQKPKTQAVQQKANFIRTSPLEVVATPDRFLNKKIIMDGKFDKFTTLGLDYKKAFRDSTKYIGFLLQRDDVEWQLYIKQEIWCLIDLWQ